MTEQFVASFDTVKTALNPPIVVIDITRSARIVGKYLEAIARLSPMVVYIHEKERLLTSNASVQEAANFALQKALDERQSKEYVLFIEDDIAFSSKFITALRSLSLLPDTGLVTLYLPDHGYGSQVIDPNLFFGTQCVLFPWRAVEAITSNWQHIKSVLPTGYDLQWSRYLASCGYLLQGTDRSYVQHIGAVSYRKPGERPHRSFIFEK